MRARQTQGIWRKDRWLDLLPPCWLQLILQWVVLCRQVERSRVFEGGHMTSALHLFEFAVGDLRLERLLIGLWIGRELMPEKRFHGFALGPQLINMNLCLGKQKVGVAGSDAIGIISDGEGELFKRLLHVLVLDVEIAVFDRVRRYRLSVLLACAKVRIGNLYLLVLMSVMPRLITIGLAVILRDLHNTYRHRLVYLLPIVLPPYFVTCFIYLLHTDNICLIWSRLFALQVRLSLRQARCAFS